MANIAMAARGPTESAIWDVDDAEFVAAAEEHLAFNRPEGHTPAATYFAINSAAVTGRPAA